MTNLNMDLTGLNANYAMRDRVFRIFKYGQLVSLDQPIFVDSLKVYLISSGMQPYELIRDTDYEIPDNLIEMCDNDVSAAKMIDPTFNKELTSGIRMLRGVESGNQITISVSGQQLYPNQIRTAYIHNTPLDWTPELAAEIITNLEHLNAITSKVGDLSSITTGGSIYLEMDLNETNESNYIEKEEHLLNVSGGRFFIHPKGGSFYKDSVKIYHPASAEWLKEGEDFHVIGMNVAKTKVTSSSSPVCDFILVTAPIVDGVLVDYHAFGGDPTIDNYRELLIDVNNIQKYLNDSNTLTSSTLGKTEIMSAVLDRIASMEDRMRRLEGTPAYGDVTSGKCILMKLFTEQNPTGLHWYTLASLYTTNGTDMRPCTADTFMFRLQTASSHIQFTAAVSVDLNNSKGNRFNVNVIADNVPAGRIPFKDYSNIEHIIRPQLRIVWLDSPRISGAFLQLGFEIKGTMEEVVSIEDLSGHESCWKLVDEISGVTLPQDDNFILPSGDPWSSVLENARTESMLVPLSHGTLIWAGAHALNRPYRGWDFMDIDQSLLLDNYTDISKVTKLRLALEELGGNTYAVDIPFNNGMSTHSGRAVDLYKNQPAYYNAELSKDEAGQIHLVLNWDVTAGLESTELTLREIVCFTCGG